MVFKKQIMIAAVFGLSGCHAERDIYPPVTRKDLALTHLHEKISFDFVPNSATLKTDSLPHLHHILTGPSPCKQTVEITIPAPSNELTRHRVKKIKETLIKNGIKSSQIHQDKEGSMMHGQTVTIGIETYRVTPPVCPDWSRSLGIADQSIPNSNFGCATTLNFYHSITDPLVLFRGHTAKSGESARQMVVAQDYRARKKLELKIEKLEKQN